MLDVGQPMARKHHLRIGDKTVFDMSNVWLPPTTSAIIELEAGVHKIEAELERMINLLFTSKKLRTRLYLGRPLQIVLTILSLQEMQMM